MTLIKIIARAVRGILGWPGPTVAADPKGAAPAPVQSPDQASVHEPKPAGLDAAFRAKEAARLKAYRASPQYQAKKAVERAARDAERGGKNRVRTPRTYAYDAHKEESEIKKERRAPIRNDWWPDDEGMRIGAEVFSTELQNKIRTFRLHWLARGDPLALKTEEQWQAQWQHWVEMQRQLRLPLRARQPPQSDNLISGDHHVQTGQRARAPGRGPGRSVAELTRERAEQSRATRAARDSN
jgi:hypothetical protein